MSKAVDPKDTFADCWMCRDDEMAFGYAPDGSGEHCPVCDNIVHEYGQLSRAADPILDTRRDET